jgi:hypothetical protein
MGGGGGRGEIGKEEKRGEHDGLSDSSRDKTTTVAHLEIALCLDVLAQCFSNRSVKLREDLHCQDGVDVTRLNQFIQSISELHSDTGCHGIHTHAQEEQQSGLLSSLLSPRTMVRSKIGKRGEIRE